MASQNRTHASDRGKAIPDLPGVPTIGTATAGAEQASVAFTPTALGGIPTSYTALSNPGSITGTGSSSPITVSGLTAGTAYTFTVKGVNTTGSGEYSSASNSITPTVATSYESIATVVGNGSATSLSFTSIASTYKHLEIRYLAGSGSGSANDQLVIRFNSDSSSANYTLHQLQGNGSAASAYGTGTGGFAGAYLDKAMTGDSSNTFGAGVVSLLDYANTNKYKTLRALDGFDANGSGYITLGSALWLNNAAITSITFTLNSGSNFRTNSQFALYGIRG